VQKSNNELTVQVDKRERQTLRSGKIGVHFHFRCFFLSKRVVFVQVAECEQPDKKSVTRFKTPERMKGKNYQS